MPQALPRPPISLLASSIYSQEGGIQRVSQMVLRCLRNAWPAVPIELFALHDREPFPDGALAEDERQGLVAFHPYRSAQGALFGGRPPRPGGTPARAGDLRSCSSECVATTGSDDYALPLGFFRLSRRAAASGLVAPPRPAANRSRHCHFRVFRTRRPAHRRPRPSPDGLPSRPLPGLPGLGQDESASSPTLRRSQGDSYCRPNGGKGTRQGARGVDSRITRSRAAGAERPAGRGRSRSR